MLLYRWATVRVRTATVFGSYQLIELSIQYTDHSYTDRTAAMFGSYQMIEMSIQYTDYSYTELQLCSVHIN